MERTQYPNFCATILQAIQALRKLPQPKAWQLAPHAIDDHHLLEYFMAYTLDPVKKILNQAPQHGTV